MLVFAAAGLICGHVVKAGVIAALLFAQRGEDTLFSVSGCTSLKDCLFSGVEHKKLPNSAEKKVFSAPHAPNSSDAVPSSRFFVE